jgi:hypothetical protein
MASFADEAPTDTCPHTSDALQAAGGHFKHVADLWKFT